MSKAITTHFLSPKLEARPHPEAGGFGVFARQPVQAGELLTVWGGQVVNLEQLRQLPESNQHHAVQVMAHLMMSLNVLAAHPTAASASRVMAGRSLACGNATPDLSPPIYSGASTDCAPLAIDLKV